MPKNEHIDIHTFEGWVYRVDMTMKEKFAIDTKDAGLDGDQLRHYWEWQQSPADFVDWFGERYDLIPQAGGWHKVVTSL